MQNVLAQLPLGLSLKDEATFDNFYHGKNGEIVAELKKMASGTGESSIYLCDSRGQGGTHLLQACCHFANQNRLSAAYLPLKDLLTYPPQMLIGFEHYDIVCIDDIHAIAGNIEWEEAVFHLFNRTRDAGGRLIIASYDLPKAIHLALPDLVSRLAWGIVYQLSALTDSEKLYVLTMRAKRRGMTLSEEVGKYLLTHCKRHMGHLFSALDELDKASLAAQRRLTIPFVKAVLKI